jgi:hypothetical protein
MAEETFTQYGFKDDETGKDFVVFSKGAKPQSIGNFESAIDKYYSNKKAVPEGFIILPQDSWSALGRGLFEKVNAPVQAAAERTDAGLPLVQRPPDPTMGPVQQLLARRTMGNPEGLPQGDPTNVGLTRGITGTVDTPGKVGLQAGLAGAGLVAAPVSIAAGPGKVVASRLGMAGNIGKATLLGGTGSVLMDAALGEPEPFNVDKMFVPFASAFATGGLQAGIGHLINKYVSPDLQKEVATNIIKPIADRYPNYKTDPTLFDAAASSPEKIADITKAMARGMRGTLDSVADTYKTDILNVIPRAMSVADQATLRAHLRRGVRAGNEMLDNMGDAKASGIAQQALQDAIQETGKFVTDIMKKSGVQNLSKTDAQVAAITKKLRTDLSDFTEGAQVLNAFRQSGQQNGFDPMAMRDILYGKVTSGQPDLMGQVARELGMGKPLQPGPPPSQPDPSSTIFDFLQKHVPGVRQIGNVIGLAKGESAVGKLPWQLQKGPLAQPIAIGVASQGQDAIDAFMNPKR